MANETLYKPSEMPSAIHELGEQLNSAKYGFEKIEEAIEYSKDGTQYESDLVIAKNTILEDNTYFEDIGEAIAEKDGGEIPEKSEMAGRIENIPTGSTQVQNPALILWDWEGTKLAEYSAEDTLALTELPSPGTLPAYAYVDHELLLFQKWNWSLANIKTWIQNHEDETLDVGAIYTTTDGQDHNYWASPRGEGVLCINKQKKGTTSIGANDFYDCHILTSINIPDGVVSIGNNAFENCYSLMSINIPNGVTSIGDSAFKGCFSLTSINIPDSITSIEDSAFYNCFLLTSINIPDGVTSIGDYTFENCQSLTSINIPDGVVSIGNNAFENCQSLTSINIPDGVTSIRDSAFESCFSLTSINIPDGVTSIGRSAFNGCSFLKSVNIPDGVTSIGDYTFFICYSLLSINIPDGVTSIGDCAFQYCYLLKSINVPDSVTSIGDSAFEGCYSLTSISIPDSVTYIGSYAFKDCENLFDILLEGKPVFPDFDILAGVPSNVKIYVPRENLSWFEAITDGTSLSIFVAIEDNIAYLESLGYNVDKYKEADS